MIDETLYQKLAREYHEPPDEPAQLTAEQREEIVLSLLEQKDLAQALTDLIDCTITREQFGLLVEELAEKRIDELAQEIYGDE